MELLMPDNTNAKRLDRIEEKLDQMGEVLVSLARFEEKMDAYNEYRERSWERMNKFSIKLDNIEKKCDDNARTVQTINKLFWVAVVAIAGSIAAQLWM
jgi:tetrahydromethanopterin S-methyltransferase subunit G